MSPNAEKLTDAFNKLYEVRQLLDEILSATELTEDTGVSDNSYESILQIEESLHRQMILLRKTRNDVRNNK